MPCRNTASSPLVLLPARIPLYTPCWYLVYWNLTVDTPLFWPSQLPRPIRSIFNLNITMCPQGCYIWIAGSAKRPDSPFIVNRLPGNKEVCTKARLAHHLQQLQRRNRGQLHWIPDSLVLPGGLSQYDAAYQPLIHLDQLKRPRASSRAATSTTTPATSSSSSEGKHAMCSKPSSRVMSRQVSTDNKRSDQLNSTVSPGRPMLQKQHAQESSAMHPTSVTEQSSRTGPFMTVFHQGLSTSAAAPKQTAGSAWIIKPTCSNRGRGIHIAQDQAAAAAWLSKQHSGSQWVVQRYIHDPLLLKVSSDYLCRDMAFSSALRSSCFQGPDVLLLMPCLHRFGKVVACQ